MALITIQRVALLMIFFASGCSFLVKDYYKASVMNSKQPGEIKSPVNKELHDVSVGIDGQSTDQGQELVNVLRKTKLFAEVDWINKLKKEPDLIVSKLENDRLNDIIVQAMDFFSRVFDYAGSYMVFGLLPARPQYNEHDFSFFIKSKDSQQQFMIPLKVKLTRVTGGWLFMTPLVLIQQWDLDKNKALSKSFRRAILRNKKQILSLISE